MSGSDTQPVMESKNNVQNHKNNDSPKLDATTEQFQTAPNDHVTGGNSTPISSTPISQSFDRLDFVDRYMASDKVEYGKKYFDQLLNLPGFKEYIDKLVDEKVSQKMSENDSIEQTRGKLDQMSTSVEKIEKPQKSAFSKPLPGVKKCDRSRSGNSSDQSNNVPYRKKNGKNPVKPKFAYGSNNHFTAGNQQPRHCVGNIRPPYQSNTGNFYRPNQSFNKQQNYVLPVQNYNNNMAFNFCQQIKPTQHGITHYKNPALLTSHDEIADAQKRAFKLSINCKNLIQFEPNTESVGYFLIGRLTQYADSAMLWKISLILPWLHLTLPTIPTFQFKQAKAMAQQNLNDDQVETFLIRFARLLHGRFKPMLPIVTEKSEIDNMTSYAQRMIIEYDTVMKQNFDEIRSESELVSDVFFHITTNLTENVSMQVNQAVTYGNYGKIDTIEKLLKVMHNVDQILVSFTHPKAQIHSISSQSHGTRACIKCKEQFVAEHITQKECRPCIRIIFSDDYDSEN